MTTPRPGTPPTPHELEVLKAYLRHGGKGAATELGLSESTVREHLFRLRVRLGVRSTAEMVYLMSGRLERHGLGLV